MTPPLDKAMERKRSLLNETVTALVAAGTYKIAEVSTAANFQIGQALEQFRDAIMKSPRPAGLDQVELEEYEAQLTELSFPFEEKAQRAYLVNIERAVALAILDPWIIRSYERMADLAPWAYQREEKVAFPVTFSPPPPLSLPPLADLDSVKKAIEAAAKKAAPPAPPPATAGPQPPPAVDRDPAPVQGGTQP
jgi:hypothetical protein